MQHSCARTNGPGPCRRTAPENRPPPFFRARHHAPPGAATAGKEKISWNDPSTNAFSPCCGCRRVTGRFTWSCLCYRIGVLVALSLSKSAATRVSRKGFTVLVDSS
ncbi:DUF6094 domain-containing protein [Agrobacterium sp. fls2-241-TYG-188a]|uniref:DUF6094 domain-containing protein n=1 Tax=Agrobacterium sp. fls2-241-TYG-188a TaxID=3040275 RepID=UPI003305AD03